jgi:hypothetical protein
MWIPDGIGRALASYLTEKRDIRAMSPATSPDLLLSALRPGDVLLVEGNARISSAVKYLTQSTWSHSALFISLNEGGDDGWFIEADLVDGVRLVGVSEYAGMHTRICRPVGLSAADRQAVVGFAMARLGAHYDLRNVIDLARYLLPNPPVPTRWRRRMLSLGSGDPTRAICSSLIAQAFEAIRYPILPEIELRSAATEEGHISVEEVLHIRHHSLFTPRDFDVSPYFEIIKPSLRSGFDHRDLKWADLEPPAKAPPPKDATDSRQPARDSGDLVNP